MKVIEGSTPRAASGASAGGRRCKGSLGRTSGGVLSASPIRLVQRHLLLRIEGISLRIVSRLANDLEHTVLEFPGGISTSPSFRGVPCSRLGQKGREGISRPQARITHLERVLVSRRLLHSLDGPWSVEERDDIVQLRRRQPTRFSPRAGADELSENASAIRAKEPTRSPTPSSHRTEAVSVVGVTGLHDSWTSFDSWFFI